MSADRLLEHFERISDAADAVPRLRRFVLDLAIRGKLLAQDSDDEPADALLERIASQPAANTRKRTRRTSLPPEQAEQQPEPFALPSSWRFTRLADIGELAPRNDAAPDSSSAFVPMAMISADFGVPASFEVRPWGQIRKGYTHVANGDVAVAKITPCFENGKSAVFRDLPGGIGAATTELYVVRPMLVDPHYIVVFLKSPFFIENGIPCMTGTAGQKRLPADYFANAPFPLPPLAEQHRIVAKVDELMALCDRLEAAQAEREARRDRLVSASLARVTEPDGDDATSTTTSARFHLDHFARMTTRPEHVKELRQTILNLAVRGRLVPQDSGSEVVADEFVNEDVDRALPANWRLLSFPRFCDLEGGSQPPKSTFVDEAKSGYVRLYQIRDLGDKPVPTYIPEASAKSRCKEGDILIGRYGASVGKIFWAKDGAYNVAMTKFLYPATAFIPDFAFLVLRSHWFQSALTNAARSAQAGFNKGDLKTVRFPLPPLAEQRRIVAKVDELMALCDQLEASFASAATDGARLLEALLHEALEPAA